MYSLFRELSIRRIALEQAPVFLASYLIANTFYKFGSFGIELVAFMATWFIFDAAYQGIKLFFNSKKQ